MDPRFHGIAWTGTHLLDVRNPDPALITARDIARCLSRKNRFGGHTSDDLPPYSVALHSLFCEAVADGMGLPVWARLQALLHDAPEYVLSDMITPVKVLLPDYSALESGLWNAVACRFRIPAEFHPAIAEIDSIALEIERLHLLPGGGWSPAPVVPGDWEVMGRNWFQFVQVISGKKKKNFDTEIFRSKLNALEAARAQEGDSE